MAFYSRENPFTRAYRLTPQPHTTDPVFPLSPQRRNPLNKNASRVLENPFHKSNYDQIFTRKECQSESKRIEERSSQWMTYIPLSRFQNRMRLKMMDNENWKRQKDREERQKLEQYGSDALRYSSYSTAHTSFAHYHSPRARDTIGKPKEEKHNKLLVFEDTPSAQYMFYDRKAQVNSPTSRRTKNNQSNTSLYNKGIQLRSQRRSQNYQIEEGPGYFGNHKSYDDLGSHNSNQYVDKYKTQQNLQSRSKSKGIAQERKYYEDQSFEKPCQFYREARQENKNYSGRPYQPNTHHYQGLGSAKSFESEVIGEKPTNPEGMGQGGKMMPYNSNSGKERTNFYDSDYIQEEQSQQRGPLSGMKFSSSSFDSEGCETRRVSRPSRFASSRPGGRCPEAIRYAGREYHLINLIL